eukprot:GGOE01024090.1.p3 GENE.GGOE01024090.1~~GGOE01024090.1.p3  ORF type:complete len:136 (-),score=3.57 GGOE01024090.1:118-525(-)
MLMLTSTWTTFTFLSVPSNFFPHKVFNFSQLKMFFSVISYSSSLIFVTLEGFSPMRPLTLSETISSFVLFGTFILILGQSNIFRSSSSTTHFKMKFGSFCISKRLASSSVASFTCTQADLKFITNSCHSRAHTLP